MTQLKQVEKIFASQENFDEHSVSVAKPIVLMAAKWKKHAERSLSDSVSSTSRFSRHGSIPQ